MDQYKLSCLKNRGGERIFFNEESFNDLWDDFKQSSICITIVPEEKEWGKNICMYVYMYMYMYLKK